jgi:hypothetical protein
MEPCNRRLPQHPNAALHRSFDHDAMQMRSPNSIGRSAGKFSLRGCAFADETNAAKGIGFALGDLDAEIAKSPDSIGQEALAARFVDGRKRTIRHDHAEAVTASRERRRQASRPTSGDKHIPRLGEFERHRSPHATI